MKIPHSVAASVLILLLTISTTHIQNLSGSGPTPNTNTDSPIIIDPNYPDPNSPILPDPSCPLDDPHCHQGGPPLPSCPPDDQTPNCSHKDPGTLPPVK